MPDPQTTQNTQNTTQIAPPGLINAAPGSTTTTPGAPAPGATPGAPVTSYTPAKADASTYSATGFDVAPNQTVASQLEGIIASGSPLMQRAEANARNMMNSRGLINSTMGVQAGQAAVIDAALPIATADAATYDRAATNTVNAQNQAAQANAALLTNTSQYNAGQESTAFQQAANASNAQSIAAQQIAGQKEIAGIQGATQQAVANMQANTSMSVAATNAQTQKDIAALNSQAQLDIAKLDAASRTAQVEASKYIAGINNASNELIAGIQRNTQLDVATINTQTQQAIAMRQDATSRYIGDLQSSTQLSLPEKTAAANKAMDELKLALQRDIANINADTTLSVADKQARTQIFVNSMNNENSQALQDKVNAGNLANIKANGVINEKLTNLQNDNKILLQTSAGAKDMYSQALKNMTDVINNPDFNAAQKTQALNNMVNQLNDGLDALGKMGNVPNLKSTLMFGSGFASYNSTDIKDVQKGISDTYKSVFGRDMTADELKGWTNNVIVGGVSLDAMKQELQDSPEYKQKKTDIQGQIAKTWESILQRPLTDDMKEYWTKNIMEKGQTIDGLAKTLRMSDEYQRRGLTS
jgi:hypothetical protein